MRFKFVQPVGGKVPLSNPWVKAVYANLGVAVSVAVAPAHIVFADDVAFTITPKLGASTYDVPVLLAVKVPSVATTDHATVAFTGVAAGMFPV